MKKNLKLHRLSKKSMTGHVEKGPELAVYCTVREVMQASCRMTGKKCAFQLFISSSNTLRSSGWFAVIYKFFV